MLPSQEFTAKATSEKTREPFKLEATGDLQPNLSCWCLQVQEHRLDRILTGSCMNSVLTVIHFWYGHTRGRKYHENIRWALRAVTFRAYHQHSLDYLRAVEIISNVGWWDFHLKVHLTYQFGIWMFCHQTNILETCTQKSIWLGSAKNVKVILGFRKNVFLFFFFNSNSDESDIPKNRAQI